MVAFDQSLKGLKRPALIQLILIIASSSPATFSIAVLSHMDFINTSKAFPGSS